MNNFNTIPRISYINLDHFFFQKNVAGVYWISKRFVVSVFSVGKH